MNPKLISGYDHLDDVPHIIIRALQGSPSPSHYSITTHSPNNPQVTSPSCPLIVSPQPAPAAVAADAMQIANAIRPQSRTPLDFPGEVLLSLPRNLSEQLGLPQDVVAAVLKQCDRAQHTTAVLEIAPESA